MPKAKRFRIGGEEGTTDGGVIDRQWPQQTADSTLYPYATVHTLSNKEIREDPFNAKPTHYIEIIVTDGYASLGTEIRTFSADTPPSCLAKCKQRADNQFSRVTALFAKKQHSDTRQTVQLWG